VLLLQGFTSGGVAVSPPKGVEGTWCTTTSLETPNVEALSKAEISSFLGLRISLYGVNLTSGTKVVRPTRYEEVRLSASKFVDEYRLYLKDIGVTVAHVNRITAVDSSGLAIGVPGDVVLVKSPTAIIWFWKGVFFEAKRCAER
jgi:hypothetical protein